MPRSTIAAAIALLLLVAPAASARPTDSPAYPNTLVQPERITDIGAQPKVMPERISDHRADAPTSSLAGTTDATTAALAQERYYSTHGNPNVAGLVHEQESVGGSGNQGVAAADDDAPWLLIALGVTGAALAAGGLTVTARRTRARVTA